MLQAVVEVEVDDIEELGIDYMTEAHRAKEAWMTLHKIGNKSYNIPKSATDEFSEFLTNYWTPEMKRAKVPPNIRALSFAGLLQDWSKDHWQEYKEA